MSLRWRLRVDLNISLRIISASSSLLVPHFSSGQFSPLFHIVLLPRADEAGILSQVKTCEFDTTDTFPIRVMCTPFTLRFLYYS